ATGYLGHLEVGKTCADIDITKPTISGELEGKKLKLTLTDNESGISGYCVNKTNDSSTCTWIDTNDDHVEYTLSSAGTYYAFAKDKKNNISDSIEFTAQSSSFCQVAKGTKTTLAYTGGVQSYKVPCDGLYQLEAWGAQGGNVGQRYEWYNGQHVASWITDAYGGQGGYTVGYVELHEGDTLYVGVGGQGGTSDSSHEDGPGGGWNGGGHAMHQGDNGGETGAGGGGGCTHFALNSNRGVLSAYSGNRDEILIVAGGGGGAAHGTGGAGNNQSAGGAFGQGGDEPFNYHGGNNAGGGCGWAGGAKAYWPSAYGGSGYIGGVNSTITFNDVTYTSSLSSGRSGHGQAAITLKDY
ncbi:MAG: hypothetical protein IJ715_03695, partial [Bacilli bacterium]|nr:hypothetical protein [Bacilli bacterium]